MKGSVGNGNTYNLNGVLSGSLNSADTAYFRVGGYTKSTDGLINNEFLNTEADHLKEESVFSQFQFELTDDTSINLRGRYTTSEAGFAYYQGVEQDNYQDFDVEVSQNVLNLDKRDVFELSARLVQSYDLGPFEFISVTICCCHGEADLSRVNNR